MSTFNVCYLREYRDPENECETFNLYETIYRNVPIKFLNKFNYYTSYADVFGDVMSTDEYKREKLHMFNDYGQQYDRSSLRKDFNPKLTKSKVYSYNGEKCH